MKRDRKLKTQNSKLVFITGGARSGKSSFALAEASKTPGNKAYIATAEPLDNEMAERIERHRKERGPEWKTFEEPVEIATLLQRMKDRYSVFLIDCLTLWLSNLLCRRQGKPGTPVEQEVDKFIHLLKKVRDPSSITRYPSIFVVSNEVGMGIVPENPVARLFRDMAGRLNQQVAGVADEVYFVASGIPLKMKG